MAVKTNKSWFIIFVLFFILMSISFARSQCVDGTYKHAGRDCCRCGAGSKVVEHCTENLKHGKCEPCEDGRFNSHPTGETKCEDCTFCTHPNENLEVDEPCTAARDAKCRCQPDHYCVSGTESCLLCHPCKKCGAEGIKWKCAGNNNTVCNEIKDKSQGGVIAGIIFAVIFVIAVCAGIAWFLWKKRQPSTGEPGNGNGEDEELQRLKGVDIQRLIPALALEIGWKDMKRVAMRSGVPDARIDACKQDNLGDTEEQTLQLLKVWVEHVGAKAPERLVEILRQSGKKAKAEKVTKILKTSSKTCLNVFVS